MAVAKEAVAVEEKDQEAQKPAAWGRALRAVRERRGLSREEVASQLRLELKLVAVIEDENVEELPLASFVKGYLRSYARLLEIDADQIVAAYEQCEHSASCRPAIAKAEYASRDTRSDDRWPRLATWVVVGVIIASFVIWWSGELLSPKPEADEAAEQASGGAESAALPTEVTEMAPAAVITEAAPIAEPEVVAVDITGEASGGEASPAAGEALPPVNEADLVEVTLIFTAESWTEVTDSRDQRMFYDLGKPGVAKTVKGLPPIRFIIGNASAVVMTYKGEPYDHMQHDRKGIARFTLE